MQIQESQSDSRIGESEAPVRKIHEDSLHRGVIFDLDGTLVDSTREIHHAICMTLQDWKLPPRDLQETAGLVGQPPSSFFEQTIPPSDIDLAVHTFRRHLESILGTESTLYEGTFELLEQCQDRGLVMGIASNKSNRLAQLVVEKLGIAEFFGAVIGTDGIPSKPSPQVVVKAMVQLNMAEGLMIGDTSADIVAGKSAGLRTVGIMHGPGGGAGLTGADWVTRDMHSLKELLNSQEVYA